MLSFLRNRESLAFVALVVVAGLLFLTGLGSRALWDIDEGMHAAMAKEMLRTGDWVTPTLNGEPFLDKPAMVNWLGAVSIAVLGRTELAARLPGALLGLGCVLLTFSLGRRMFDARTAFLAGLILATSLLFLLLTRAVVYDVILTFFTTLSLLWFYSGFAEEDEHRRFVFFLLFYVAVALGVLTKGPLGAVLPGLIIVPFIASGGRWRILKVMELHLGALIFLGITMPWYVLVSVRNPEFVSHFFLGQNVGYFASQGSRHPQPVYYYVLVLLVGLFPWSTLIPQAFSRALVGLRRRPSPEMQYLVLWTGVIFVFFTAAVSKLPPYMLPIFPAAALLLARLWRDLLETPTDALRRGVIGALVPLVVIVTGALVYGVARPPVELTEKYGIPVSLVYILFGIMAFLLAAALFLLWRRRHAASFAALATVNVSVVLFFVLFVAPLVDPYRSTKGLSSTMDELVPAGEPLCFYKTLKDSALFYTDRQAVVLDTPEELRQHLESGPGAVCVVERKKLSGLGGLPDRFQVVAEEGNKLLVGLSSNGQGY